MSTLAALQTRNTVGRLADQLETPGVKALLEAVALSSRSPAIEQLLDSVSRTFAQSNALQLAVSRQAQIAARFAEIFRASAFSSMAAQFEDLSRSIAAAASTKFAIEFATSPAMAAMRDRFADFTRDTSALRLDPRWLGSAAGIEAWVDSAESPLEAQQRSAAAAWYALFLVVAILGGVAAGSGLAERSPSQAISSAMAATVIAVDLLKRAIVAEAASTTPSVRAR